MGCITTYNKYMKMKKEYKLLVKGRVQGVGFRYYTCKIAEKYDAKGYVRNTEEGDVEIVLQIEPVLIAEILTDIRKGPGLSRVDEIKVFEKEIKDKEIKYRAFNIEY